MKQDTERGRELLEEALALVAESGIAGASLRKLASKLGLSQPSLYHYFESKDDLIDQLAEYGARHMVSSMDLPGLLALPLLEIPHHAKDKIFELWTGETHVRYSKFLLVLAIESPRHRVVIERVFSDRLLSPPEVEVAALFAQAPILANTLFEGLLMLARAIGFALLEDRILFGHSAPSDRTRRHADFVATSVSRLLEAVAANAPPTAS